MSMRSNLEILIEPKASTQTIDLICKLAKKQNKEALASLISSGVSINIFDEKGTAAERITFDPHLDQEALELLISMGANLDTVISAAAAGGHFIFVENLLSRGAQLNRAVEGAGKGDYRDFVDSLIRRGAKLDSAAEGAARGGHHHLVNSLIHSGAKLDSAVKGAAMGGHRDLVDSLVYRGASINTAVFYAASKGHFDLVESLISRGASLNHAVYGAAGGNYRVFVNELIRRGALLDNAVIGAAMGGHRELMNNLIHRGASLDNAAKGAAGGNNLDLLNNLIHRGASLGSAAVGAAAKGHSNLVNRLIRRGASVNDAAYGAAHAGKFDLVFDFINRGALLKNAVNGAADGHQLDNEVQTLRCLTSLPDPKLRKSFVDEIKHGNHAAFDMRSLLAEANTIATQIQTKGITFEQSISWQKSSEIQGLFAFCRTQEILPRDLWFLIATYFTLTLTSEKETKNLFNKISFDIRKTDISIDLKQYYVASSWFSFYRDERPSKFRAICQKTQSDEELDKSIEDEIHSLTERDSYLDLLEKHALRK